MMHDSNLPGPDDIYGRYFYYYCTGSRNGGTAYPGQELGTRHADRWSTNIRLGCVRNGRVLSWDSTYVYGSFCGVYGLSGVFRVEGGGSPADNAPVSPRAAAGGMDAIDLSWDPPADTGGRNVDGYRVEWPPNGNAPWTALAITAATGPLRYRDTSLPPGTTRTFRAGYGYRPGEFLDLGVEASRREAANDDSPGHEITLRARVRW